MPRKRQLQTLCIQSDEGIGCCKVVEGVTASDKFDTLPGACACDMQLMLSASYLPLTGLPMSAAENFEALSAVVWPPERVR